MSYKVAFASTTPIATARTAIDGGCAYGTWRNRKVWVFAGNLRDLLLVAPAGPRVTMGLDPGLSHRVKVAVVDATGKVVATTCDLSA